MTRPTAALLGLALLAVSPAQACPQPSPELLFHSCWGRSRAEVALLPEEALKPAPEQGLRLTVTGAYTGKEPRDGGHPNPVGFFMDEGRVVNPNMTRMDGLLIIEPESGTLSLHDRSAVPLGGRTYNLRRVAPRRAFTEAAVERGLSVLQSHLLVIDGEPDVSDQEDAPRFRRRVLFTDADGYGIYQSIGAETLYDTTARLEQAFAPDMALNLDMGSYDFCLRAEEGVERRCGTLDRDGTEKLSNLLVFTLRKRS